MTKHGRTEWADREDNRRPTPERQKHGAYRIRETMAAGVKVAVDEACDDLTALNSRNVIAPYQWDAAERFEELARRIIGDVGQRSCINFEPVGHDGGEGDPRAEGSWKVVRLKLGPVLFDVVYDAAYLRREIVNVQALRDGLDVLAEYFGTR